MPVMTKETTVFVCGIMLTIVPFLGIPSLYKVVLTVGLGVILTLTGYALRRARFLITIDRGNGERAADSFVETTEPLFDERTLQ